MMEKIESPMARAVVRWRTTDEGGRYSGPPAARVYMATSIFVLGKEVETEPGWPESGDQLSILLEKLEGLDEGAWFCAVGFLVPDLASPYLHPGANLLILEGLKTVASAQVTEVFS
ncbi:hypothetical protein FFT09_02465 [Saccharomonospora piscinae]|uniref:hypothetical protein n=1 Tax=Saccharomonospora piscinae TaxID=687388 RepID=UPI001106327B|nr:hypothetical protein [Saccharomonospora piscinae]TLW94758.1 hypothetical protein FFT09_02465 [Saccharomonospora piscinae]